MEHEEFTRGSEPAWHLGNSQCCEQLQIRWKANAACWHSWWGVSLAVLGGLAQCSVSRKQHQGPTHLPREGLVGAELMSSQGQPESGGNDEWWQMPAQFLGIRNCGTPRKQRGEATLWGYVYKEPGWPSNMTGTPITWVFQEPDSLSMPRMPWETGIHGTQAQHRAYPRQHNSSSGQIPSTPKIHRGISTRQAEASDILLVLSWYRPISHLQLPRHGLEGQELFPRDPEGSTGWISWC